MKSAPDAVRECIELYSRNERPDRELEKAATKAVTAELVAIAPGKAVEFRVPPHVAVQLVEGPAHRRGTPPALVELKARDLFDLAVGAISWVELRKSGRLSASGERSDLSYLFPCFTLQD